MHLETGHGSLADARQCTQRVPIGGSVVVLIKIEVLRQIVNEIHTPIACYAQFAHLCRGQPIHIEHTNRAITETQDAQYQVLIFIVNAALGFCVDSFNFCIGQVAHYIKIVRGEVECDAHIADTWRERTKPPGVQVKNLTKFASDETSFDLYHRRVKTLNVSDRDFRPAPARELNERLAFVHRAGHGFFDQHGDSAI